MTRKVDSSAFGDSVEFEQPLGCSVPLRFVLLLLVLVAGAELWYGATAWDTIGGLNYFSTLLTILTSLLGLGLATFGRLKRTVSPRLFTLAVLLFLGLFVGAVIVLRTRQFRAGYGP